MAGGSKWPSGPWRLVGAFPGKKERDERERESERENSAGSDSGISWTALKKKP